MRAVVEGLAALLGQLETLREGIPRAAGEALPPQAALMAEEARVRVPVETGALRESVASAGEGLEATVTAGAGYAKYVELGTFRTPPRPFLLPAYEARREAAVQAVAEALADL